MGSHHRRPLFSALFLSLVPGLSGDDDQRSHVPAGTSGYCHTVDDQYLRCEGLGLWENTALDVATRALREHVTGPVVRTIIQRSRDADKLG